MILSFNSAKVRFIQQSHAVVTDDGYPPFTNPEYHDYRERTPQCETVRLAVPDIPNRGQFGYRELLYGKPVF